MSTVAIGIAVAAAFGAIVSATWQPCVPARVREHRVAGGRRAARRPARRSTARRRRQIARVLFVGAVASTAGIAAGGAAGTGLLVHRQLVALRRRRAAAVAVEAAYPDLVDLLVLTIKAGCSPLQAFAALDGIAPPPTRTAVDAVVRRVRGGARFADAVVGLRAPPPLGLGPISQPLADALALADRHGTPLPPVLDRLAGEARDHRRRHADIAARQLPIRLAFPLVGCTLPSFVLLTIVPLMAGTFSSLRGITP